MITLNLKPIFAARGIERPYSFLIRQGFTHEAATSLVSGKRTMLNMKHMERLCEVLWCEPNDLFLWQPHADKEIATDHPLIPLLHREEAEPLSIRRMMARVPLKKIPRLSDKLNEEIKGTIGLE